MKAATQTIISIVVLVACCSGSFYLYKTARDSERRVYKKIEQISTQKQRIVNTDSLRDVIEKHIVDSLTDVISSQDRKIRKMQTDLIKTRQENEKLQNLYNSLTVRMPEF